MRGVVKRGWNILGFEENGRELPQPLPPPCLSPALSLCPNPYISFPFPALRFTANPRVGTALNRADGAMLGCQPGLCSSWTTEAHHTFLIGGPDSSSARFLRYPHLFAAATAID